MAKCYFGEGEEVMERLVVEFKEALREEGITTPGITSAIIGGRRVLSCVKHRGRDIVLQNSETMYEAFFKTEKS